MQKNHFLKVKNSLLELEKYFIELKDRELKHREEKIKRDRRIIFKSVMVSIYDMGKFEQQKKNEENSAN